jgi:predicted ATPase/DNA-binding CsgD family transcriptional regulator
VATQLSDSVLPDAPSSQFLHDRSPLPQQLTSLIGRTREVREIAALLRRDDVCLLTLTGPGGIGKTRVALAAASDAAPAFTDGAAFVDLASLRDPSLVVPTIASALGLRQGTDRPLLVVLAEYLRTRCVLLVLDNVEQVEAAATDIATLVDNSRGLTVLATSRSPLHVHVEQEYPVPPLALHPDSTTPGAAMVVADAVALFVERARLVRPAFVLDEANAATITEICCHLDGVPLAIELAAARIKVLSPRALLSRLGSGLAVLTGGPHDQPARQQTMRDAIAWSYDLLSAEEQMLFRRLAVFAGGFTLEAAETVVTVLDGNHSGRSNPGSVWEAVLDGITSLVDKSLLQPLAEGDTESRFGMLEIIREYGVEHLEESGEGPALRAVHAAYVRDLITMARPHLEGADRLSTIARIEREQANVRAALSWVMSQEDLETAQCLASEMARFWAVLGVVGEGGNWLDRVVGLSTPSRPRTRSIALYWAADFAILKGSYERADVLITEALNLARRDGGDPHAAAMALRQLGVLHQCRKEFAAAQPVMEEALACFTALGDRVFQGIVLRDLGLLASHRGDHDASEAYHEEALTLWRELEHPWGVPSALRDLADHALVRGDIATAASRYRESLEWWGHLREKIHLLGCLFGAARVALARGQIEEAARLFGATEASHEALGVILRPDRRADLTLAVTRAREALGEATFAAAWQSGRRLPWVAAVAEAIQVTAGSEAIPPASRRLVVSRGAVNRYGLTEREVEVLHLLVAGRSNAEIANALFISTRTAQTHVANLFTKLNVQSRSAAVAEAFRRRLA